MTIGSDRATWSTIIIDSYNIINRKYDDKFNETCIVPQQTNLYPQVVDHGDKSVRKSTGEVHMGSVVRRLQLNLIS